MLALAGFLLLHAVPYARAQAAAEAMTLAVSGAELHVLTFDGKDKLVLKADTPPIIQPGSWATLNKDATRLWVSDENANQLFAYDTAGGKLTQKVKVPVNSKGPVYSGLVANESFLLTSA
jgi:6-phosphogluconolactonase (cycloisomerase 2 family)